MVFIRSLTTVIDIYCLMLDVPENGKVMGMRSYAEFQYLDKDDDDFFLFFSSPLSSPSCPFL